MPVIRLVSGIQVVYDSTTDTADKNIITGAGSILTMVVTGTTGQTAVVKGSLDGVIWVDIASFTLEAGQSVLSSTLQVAYVFLQVSGDASIKIARSAA